MDSGDDGGSISGAGDSGSEGVNKIPAKGRVSKVGRKWKTAFQLKTLDKAFAVDPWPSRKVRASLSARLRLTDRQLQFWFSNKRIKEQKTPRRSKKEASSSDGGNEHGGSGFGSSSDTFNSHVWSDLTWSKTKKRARRNTNSLKKRDVEITKTSPNNQTQTHLPATGIQSLDDDGDVERLDPKQEQCELVENTYPMSDSVEKLSSPQSNTICVQGYQVKPSNAPILEVIFRKHGDIAAGCVFETDIMRSTLLDVVCEVVRQIHTSNIIEKMEEIESRVSRVEATKIDVTWLRTHFQKKMKLFKKTNLLLKTKKNTILARCAALKDLKEAEKRVELIDLLEKNINDALMESKGELDSLLQHEFL